MIEDNIRSMSVEESDAVHSDNQYNVQRVKWAALFRRNAALFRVTQLLTG